MRVAYIDCFAGISGDMLLGALIDAGVPAEVLEDATAAHGLGAKLWIERVDRSGICCTKVHVFDGDHLADATPDAAHAHESVEQQPLKAEAHSHQPKTQHQHKIGHAHTRSCPQACRA
jgi:uncharacterized protein (DUF111 family)